MVREREGYDKEDGIDRIAIQIAEGGGNMENGTSYFPGVDCGEVKPPGTCRQVYLLGT